MGFNAGRDHKNKRNRNNFFILFDIFLVQERIKSNKELTFVVFVCVFVYEEPVQWLK